MNVAAPGTLAGLVRLTSVAAVPAVSPGNGKALGQNKNGAADGGGTGGDPAPAAPASTSGTAGAAAPAAAGASSFVTSSDRAVARARTDTARFAGAVNDIKALRADLTAARAATLAAQEGADPSGAAAARHAIERTGGRLAAVLGTKLGGHAFRGATDAEADASDNVLNVLGTSLSRSGAAPAQGGTGGGGTAPAAPASPSPAPAAESLTAPDDLVPAAPSTASVAGTTPTDPTSSGTPPASPSGGNTTPTDPSGGTAPPAHGSDDTPPAHGGHGGRHAPGEVLRSLLERAGDLAKHGGTESLPSGGAAAAARQAAGAYRKAAALAHHR